jgi:mannose-1-phosphate guanylyltransferase
MQLPQLPATNFIVEPQGRNTGPALALAAAVLNAREPGGTALSMPADQAIHADLPFYASLESAVRIASDPVLAMLGISPKSGAVGLGYLRTGQTVATNEPLVVQELIGLIEKPERSLAGQLAASGSYLWNTGIMAWRPEVLVDFFRACQPDMMTEMENVARTLRTDDFQRRLGDLYKRLEGYPIETAMLKHLPRARVLNVDISWSDVGTWDGIFDLMSLDGDDNRISGKAFAVNSRRVSIYNEKGPIIAVAGIDDIFVVAMNGRVLITRRDQAHLLRHISDIDEM